MFYPLFALAVQLSPEQVIQCFFKRQRFKDQNTDKDLCILRLYNTVNLSNVKLPCSQVMVFELSYLFQNQAVFFSVERIQPFFVKMQAVKRLYKALETSFISLQTAINHYSILSTFLSWSHQLIMIFAGLLWHQRARDRHI